MLDFVAAGQISELLLEHVPAMVAVFDVEMRYLAVSKRWRDYYELGDRDLTGVSHYQLFPEIPDRWRAIHRRVMAGGSLSSDLEPFQRANGTIDWVEWEMLPWRGQSGEVGGAILLAQMRNDLVEAQEREKGYSSTLDLLMDAASEFAITMLDTEGIIIYWGKGAERLYGWKEAEAVGRSAPDLVLPAELRIGNPLPDIMHQADAHGPVSQREQRVRKDGSRFTVDANLSAIRNSAGKIMGYVGVTRDLSRQLDNENRLATSAAKMQVILDTVPDALVMIDEHGIIESFSATAEQLFGYSASEVLGKNVSMLMPEPDASRHDSYLEKYRSTGERKIVGNVRRVLGLRKDGSTFPHELYIGEANAGGARLFTGFIRDLTRRETASRHLRELEEELSQISRMTAVGTMATALAHEINQPLTAIANYMQTAAALLSEEKCSSQLREALAEAGSEAIRAGQIVQRLRQFLSNGDIERELVSVEELVQQTGSLAFMDSEIEPRRFTVTIEPNMRPLLVDRIHVQQILINLLRNAREASGKRGRVSLQVKEEQDAIRFSVIDNGPGVPPEAVSSLFDPFFSSKITGMGLGLAICKTMVELHGGQLWHEHVKGGGAAFHFTIPTSETRHA